MHNHPHSRVMKFHFGKLFSRSLNKGATVRNAVKGYGFRDMFTLKPSTIPDDKFLPPRCFHQLSTDSFSSNIPNQTLLSSPGNPNPTG